MASTMATKSSGATASMSNLTLNPSAKSKKTPLADSWEDEEDSDSEGTAGPSSPRNDNDDSKPPSSGFAAPPPTPISPTSHSDAPWQSMTGPQEGGLLGPDTTAERKRPEKTDAVARRMIASALGVKAPKQTDEQKAYDRALREQERKRRDAERMAERRRKEEAERAKAAIWDD